MATNTTGEGDLRGPGRVYVRPEPRTKMMQSFRTLCRSAAMALLVSASGCRDATGVLDDGGILAVARNQHILITNKTQKPIFTFVVGRNSAALINWHPCVEGPLCPPLLPGHVRSEPYPAAGFGEREVVVYWWVAVRGPGGVMQADRIRARIVAL